MCENEGVWWCIHLSHLQVCELSKTNTWQGKHIGNNQHVVRWPSTSFVPLMCPKSWRKFYDQLVTIWKQYGRRKPKNCHYSSSWVASAAKAPRQKRKYTSAILCWLGIRGPPAWRWFTLWSVGFKRCEWWQLPDCERYWVGHLWAEMLLQKTRQLWQIERLNNQNILQLLISNDLIVASLHACNVS